MWYVLVDFGSVYNYSTTRKVNLNMMIEHTKSTRIGVKKPSSNDHHIIHTGIRSFEKFKKGWEKQNVRSKVEGGTRVAEIVSHP